MHLLDLYKEENKRLLYNISWLNKNSIFDKSIGKFVDIDLFTFLENISKFDYEKDTYFDDVYYILEYTQDSILYLISNINEEIRRDHKIVQLSQAKEFDKKSVLWISRQNGRTLKEKLSNGKIKAVQRYKNIDTYENRIFKIFLKKLLEIYEIRNDINKFEQLFIKIRRWLKSDEANNIDEYKKIVYNNILLHHPHYSKIFRSYKWINSLNEKLKNINIDIKYLIKYELLCQLHFFSKELLLPDSLDKENILAFNEHNSLLDYEIDNTLREITTKKIKDELKFPSIRKFIKYVIIKKLKFNPKINRTFEIKEDIKNLYIDLFRLFPIAKIDDNIVNFPITLKQKIDKKVVNANNTKVINLNYQSYTLPEILSSYDTDILKYFLEDLKKHFKKTKLNYIIPDYVNIFEFTQSKKMISSYFKQNKPIPKSILAGLTYIFEKKVKENDTLIYIQRSPSGGLFVTPLLIKYNNKLKSITNGFYLERYPTKNIENANRDILNSLSHIFDKNTSKVLLNKFLQNGLKKIKKENIVFYQKDKIKDLNSFRISKSRFQDKETIKSLYNISSLFNKQDIFIEDTNEENLFNFEKLLQLEAEGFNIWKEHLPNLSMEIQKNAWWEDFILVNDETKLIEKTVKIDNLFIIPKDVNELYFPLRFGDEKINYKAYLSSEDFPYSDDVECKLNLTYDYERETPYELVFEPINRSYKNINVQWKKQSFENIVLPIPNYPIKKPWEDFTKDPKRNGIGHSDLLDWILERLALLKNIYEVPKFILEREIKKAQTENKKKGHLQWGKYDKHGEYFCFVDVEGEKVFCHSKNFKEEINTDTFYEGMIVYLKIKENFDGTKMGQNIIFTDISEKEIVERIREEYLKTPLERRLQPIINSIRSIKYPLLTVWNNHSLTDIDVPDSFRNLIYTYINLSLKYMSDQNIPVEFRNELFDFLSHIHQDMPIQIANTLIKYSISLQRFNNLAVSIGNCILPWQEQILKNIFNYFDKHPDDERVFDILAISLWRSEIMINKITQMNIEKIVLNLLPVIQMNFKSVQLRLNGRTLGQLVKKIELLLGLLRARNKFNLLYPSDPLSLKYIEKVNEITKYVIDNKIDIKTRIKLDINKGDSFFKTPDILYALRIYLTADSGVANNIKVLGVSDD